MENVPLVLLFIFHRPERKLVKKQNKKKQKKTASGDIF